MNNFLSQYKKPILSLMLILIISSLGIFVFGAGEANAWDPFGIAEGIKSIFGSLLLTIQGIFGTGVAWMSGLCQGILNLTNPQKAQMVQDGWKTTRDLVNMFFVLILLIIAFATILRLETYGMKALLPKLIIAALLINFSLVFAGAIIDFAGILTNFFLEDRKEFFTNIGDQMRLPMIVVTNADDVKPYWCCVADYTGDDVCLGTKHKTKAECAANAGITFCACQEIKPSNNEVDWGKIKGDKFWKVIGSLILSIIFTIIALFVFGAFAALLLIRVIIIWFLLILAPIAWFFWILPDTRPLFTKWWNAFIKWVFFAPAAIFFIWLSVNTWMKKAAPGGEIVVGMKEIINKEVMESQVLPQMMAPTNLIQFLIACGMLIGSLIVAQKMSIYGAKGAIGIAKGIGGKVSGVAATQRWWKARKSAREEGAKERVKNKQRLSGVSGAGQWTREHLRLTPKGRAEAREKKNTVVTQESQRMGKSMNRQDVQKIAGRRTLPFGAGKTQKLAAQSLLANPRSAEYKQMMSRSTKLRPGIPKYKKLKKLARRVNLNVAHREKAGEFNRYKLKQEKGKKGKPTLNEQQKIIMPSENKGESGEKISYAEREKIKKEAGIT